MASPAPEVFATEAAQTMVEDGNGGAPVHVEPELWGLAPFQIVSISMLVLLLIGARLVLSGVIVVRSVIGWHALTADSHGSFLMVQTHTWF